MPHTTNREDASPGSELQRHLQENDSHSFNEEAETQLVTNHLRNDKLNGHNLKTDDDACETRLGQLEDNEDDYSSKITDQRQPLTNHDVGQDGVPTWMWEEYEKETRCGIFDYYPNWLQTLASKKSYVIVFGTIGLFNVVIGTYYSSTISTVEKRFKISSRTSGVIISALEIGSLGFTLILSYMGGRGHKTRWLAGGTVLTGLSCFLRLLPHLLYGPGQDALELTLEYGTANSSSSANYSKISNNPRDLVCTALYEDNEDCLLGNSNAPVIILFCALYLMGVGICPYYTLGMAYLDDNVRKDKAPFLLSVGMCMRMFGSTLGFLLGSYSLSRYVDISAHPTITTDDPRWIGAWWLGWGPLGCVSAGLALCMALFPKKLPRAAQRAIREACVNKEVPKKTAASLSFKDFKEVLSRLVKNKVLVCNSFSTVIFLFGLIGYWTFMPKYMETQFRQTAAKSSFVLGAVTITSAALGIMVSGSFISKFKPRARTLAAWNVFVEILDILGFISYAFLNCTVDDLHGTTSDDGSWNLTAACNSQCDCGTNLKYSPVCSADGSTTFYSACHAGCTTLEMINGTKMFGNCSCIGDDATGWATDGVCPVDCSIKFTVFIVLRCVLTFFSSTGRAGNTMVQFRCVDPEDKAVSMGLTDALVSALALIPGPVMFGLLLDSACMVWGQTCGERGNCWLYDGQRLGYLVNFTASAGLMIGTVLDICVWYYVKDLELYDKKDEEASEVKKETDNRIHLANKTEGNSLAQTEERRGSKRSEEGN